MDRAWLQSSGANMESGTFRKWLAERGCSFHKQEHHKGKHPGPGHVTVHRGGRTAVLPLIGSKKRLDPDLVKRIVEDLGLEWSELPGPASRV